MLRHALFIVVAAFFVVMNILLWQAEYGGAFRAGGSVPVERLWELILTAPDESSLDILHRGNRVGSLRWVPSVDEAPASGSFSPEGMASAAGGYRIAVDANLILKSGERRFRLTGAGQFGADRELRRVNATLVARPMILEVDLDALARQVETTLDLAGTRQKATLGFDNLRDPRELLRALGFETLVPLLPRSMGTAPVTNLAAYARWTGSHDWLRLGESRLRVYQLHAQLPERRSVVIKLSRTGEILHVQLPGQISLANDAFIH